MASDYSIWHRPHLVALTAMAQSLHVAANIPAHVQASHPWYLLLLALCLPRVAGSQMVRAEGVARTRRASQQTQSLSAPTEHLPQCIVGDHMSEGEGAQLVSMTVTHVELHPPLRVPDTPTSSSGSMYHVRSWS